MAKVLSTNLKKRGGLMERRDRAGFVFIAPFLIGFLAFMLIPLIQSFRFSFADIKIVQNGYTAASVGWSNYKQILLVDTTFRRQIVNSFLSTMRDTVVVLPFSFFSALVLSKDFKGRTLSRAIFFLPVIVSTGVLATMDSDTVISMVMNRNTVSASSTIEPTASALSFVYMLLGNTMPTGVMNFIATATDGIYDIIIKSGLQINIFIGGLNTIPASIYESSNIEGATGWVNFWKITFPMCGPYILLCAIYTIIDSFTNMNNQLISRIRADLIGLKNFGVASAAAWIYFGMIFLVLAVAFRLISKKVFYNE